MESSLLKLCLFLLLLSRSIGGLVFNVTFNPEELQNKNQAGGLDVILSATIKIYCPEGKSSYSVYNLQENDYTNCVKGGDSIVIGSCVHSPLNIDVKTLSLMFEDEVSYVVGDTYYYGVFDSDGVCVDQELKFKVNVVSSLEIEEHIVTSSVVPTPSPSPSPSPSVSVVSSVHQVSSNPPSSTIKSSSSISTTVSSRVTMATRPVRPVSSSPMGTRPTNTVTRPTDSTDDPVVDGLTDGVPVSKAVSFLLISLLVLAAALFHTLL